MRTPTLLTLTFSLVIGSLITGTIAPQTARADGSIVTVDINRVLNQADDSKEKLAAIDKRTKVAKEQIDDRREDLQEMESKIKSGRINPDSKEAEQFRRDAREFARYVKDTEEELKRDFAKSSRELTERVLKVVAQYAQEKNIGLVLDKSASARGPVIFGAAQSDITDAIIERINN